MTFEDIINDLHYGELNSHGMFMTALTEQDKQKLIAHANIALTALYTRFPLLTRELTIIQMEGKTAYELTSKHAITDKTHVGYDKYIIDSVEFPFNNDLVRVLSAYDEEGNEIRINDSTACPVITTPAYNVIEVPIPVDTNALFLIYQAKHPIIVDQDSQVYIPEQFRPALLAYIAHRVYSGGTAQEHVMLSNQMYQKYELICIQNREYGVDNSFEGDRNIKPCLGGWV